METSKSNDGDDHDDDDDENDAKRPHREQKNKAIKKSIRNWEFAAYNEKHECTTKIPAYFFFGRFNAFKTFASLILPNQETYREWRMHTLVPHTESANDKLY